MATILRFRPGALERDVRDGAVRARATAEVIVFPGVRYERWDDASGAERSKSSKTRNSDARRDVLELVE